MLVVREQHAWACDETWSKFAKTVLGTAQLIVEMQRSQAARHAAAAAAGGGGGGGGAGDAAVCAASVALSTAGQLHARGRVDFNRTSETNLRSWCSSL